jgi:hypothetical protein
MAVFSGPNPTSDGLLLAVDFINQKNYSPNIIPTPTDLFSTYNSTTVNLNNCTLARDYIYSPVGGIPLKMTPTSTDPHFSSYNDPAFNLGPAEAGQTWTISCYAKSNTISTFEFVIFGANTGGVTYENDISNFRYIFGDGESKVTTTSWQRYSSTFTITNTNNSYPVEQIQMRLDGPDSGNAIVWFDGLQLERGNTATEFNSRRNTNGTSGLLTNNTTYTIRNPNYTSVSNGAITFSRAASTANKLTAGGGIYSSALSGPLAVSNFLYNNFTWEVWFKINDVNASNYDFTEDNGFLAAYPGFHSGFLYNFERMAFFIWNGTSNPVECATWTVGTSGAQINQGNWYQVVVTRSGNVFTPYVNGVQTGTGSTSSPSSSGIIVSDTVAIGAAPEGYADYNYYTKMDFSNMKMYNRALSAAEVSNNFNSLRLRFGL